MCEKGMFTNKGSVWGGDYNKDEDCFLRMVYICAPVVCKVPYVAPEWNVTFFCLVLCGLGIFHKDPHKTPSLAGVVWKVDGVIITYP